MRFYKGQEARVHVFGNVVRFDLPPSLSFQFGNVHLLRDEIHERYACKQAHDAESDSLP